MYVYTGRPVKCVYRHALLVTNDLVLCAYAMSSHVCPEVCLVSMLYYHLFGIQGVHDFIATGCGSSKFGVKRVDVASMLDDIAAEPLLKLLGLHCHLGSTIDDVDIFR